MSEELYKKHRPQELDDVVGQEAAISSLKNLLNRRKLPHAILFTGPSGVGKTTTARILARKVKCRLDGGDYHELDAAQVGGIDSIRRMSQDKDRLPMSGEAVVWTLDEAHQLTGAASNALLKLLEDSGDHIYFFLCTTEPGKIKNTIKTRCHQAKFVLLPDPAIREILVLTAAEERRKLAKIIVDKIVDLSYGSARQALVLLNGVIGFNNLASQVEFLSEEKTETLGIDLARALCDPRFRWPGVAGILQKLNPNDVETVRWIVMGYCKAILLSNTKPKPFVANILQVFMEDFKDSGINGLTYVCWDITQAKEGNKDE